MSGGTAIALSGIAVSGVVGPSLSAAWSRVHQRAEQRREFGHEVRDVLDEAAHALGQTKRAFERVYVLHRRGCPREHTDVSTAFEEWRKALLSVRYCEDRMAIRLGADHEVHLRFVACMRCLEERRPFAWAYERGEPIAEPLEQEERAHAAYGALRTTFVDACRAYTDHEG
jgi:hypothetical protein